MARFTAGVPSRVLGLRTMCAVCSAFIISAALDSRRQDIGHNIFSESYGQVYNQNGKCQLISSGPAVLGWAGCDWDWDQ